MGPLAIATMQGIRVRKAILGAGGIMPDGIYNSNLLLVETERQMMACGQEVVIVADSSKFGRLSLSRLCGLDEVAALVSDPRMPAEYRSTLEAAGVVVHTARADEHHGSNGAVTHESTRNPSVRTEE
jgi:DeoR/GlpR family transcriptional regulator of sugar metabolism